ncbi:MAG: hydrogenase nickel incorporation protein HypB [Eubacteriales bacterium]|jgi:hydrogenase nickel incorporation protein HypB
MDPVKIIRLKESILADNDADAEELRRQTKDAGLCYVNLMSSPGSGKTSTILALIDALKKRGAASPLSIGIMEADIDSDVDAQTIQDKAGVPAVQLHTGGMCHLDAEMSRQGLRALGIPIVSRATSILTMPSRERHFDLVILENVGNLVCPAEFDTGADLNLVILSVPEGDDKPLKYPLVFTKCDAVIINKIDALPVFNFDIETCTSYIRERSASAEIFPVSAKTGEGIDRLADWLEEKVRSRISGR